MSTHYPWTSEYNALGIPYSLQPYPEKPVYHILERASKKNRRNGLIQNGYKLSYSKMNDHVDRLATALHNLGLKKGERAATILPTSIQFAICDYAISRLGLVHIPVSSLDPVDKHIEKFEDALPSVLIIIDTFANEVKEILKAVSIKHVIITNIDEYSKTPPRQDKELPIKGALSLSALIKETEPAPPAVEINIEKDMETLLFTGGTTGRAKGCMLTHRNIYANAIQISYAVGFLPTLMTGSASILLGLPLFHSYGHIIMHAMMHLGFNIILIPDPRDVKSMAAMIKEHLPVMHFGVPTQFMQLAGEGLKDVYVLGLSAAAPLPPKTQEDFEEKSAGGIMEAYGLSELSPATHSNPSLLFRMFGSRLLLRTLVLFLKIPFVFPLSNLFLRIIGRKNVGRIGNLLMGLALKLGKRKKARSSGGNVVRGSVGIPLPDTEMKIIEVETGKELSWDDMLGGKQGELCLKGPQRMLGYWPDEGSGLDDEGYVRTSDVVRIDKRGYFYIVDRTKDMIIVSGYKVYSREVDDILYSYPGIELAGTIGIPDPEREGSELVIVFVKPKENYREKLSENKVINFLKTKVPKYSIPQRVHIIDKMPLTAVQKVDKKLLREMAIHSR